MGADVRGRDCGTSSSNPHNRHHVNAHSARTVHLIDVLKRASAKGARRDSLFRHTRAQDRKDTGRALTAKTFRPPPGSAPEPIASSPSDLTPPRFRALDVPVDHLHAVPSSPADAQPQLDLSNTGLRRRRCRQCQACPMYAQSHRHRRNLHHRQGAARASRGTGHAHHRRCRRQKRPDGR